MIDFFILYEIPTRELESVIILGNELKCRGYSVEYASFYDVSKEDYFRTNRKWKKYRNNIRVLLVPSFYHNNELLDVFYYPFGKVEKIVNLRWEQYFINEIMDNPLRHLYLYPCESGKKAYQVCWGHVSHQNMLDAGIAEDRLLETGPLHMDILRKEFSKYYQSKSDLLSPFHLDSNKQTVLFISSFANATDKSTYYKFLDRYFSGNYKIDYSRIDMERASYEIALKWFDDFMDSHPDVNFVYRPHPSEFITEQLRTLETKYPNFKIISEHSVKQWILVCETIVTWMSTAIIEAYFANKPCFIIRPVEFPIEKDMCVYRGAKFISEEDEFLHITDSVCENSLSDEYVHQCYDVQETPSYVRLCDELERIIRSQDNFPWDKKLTRKFDRTRPVLALKNLGSIIKSKIKRGVIKLMLALRKTAKISFGQRINDKLAVRTINSQKYNYRIGFNEKNEVLGSIVREQRALRNLENR